MRIALKIGYDGTLFNGFARQKGKETVEGEILKILKKSKIVKDIKEAKFQYAARTDRGVSAIANVISFNCRGNALRIFENSRRIWIFGYAYVDENFNPRHCKSKRYRYYVYDRGYDIKKMIEAVKIFEGEHDFAYFVKDKRRTISRIDKIEVIKGKIIKFDFEGKFFLWNQIRRIMAAVLGVGEGKYDIEDVKKALKKEERINFGLAKPENLILIDIKYDFEFIPFIQPDFLIKNEIFKDIAEINKY
ncbi:MAG: tRNA pseudouridine(38-40) synthase TruA [Thermoplasmatales archaeon]|nr:tRNA pseudouridine(38-40) synthase TruA [Thermoplasmatales archaeon]